MFSPTDNLVRTLSGQALDTPDHHSSTTHHQHHDGGTTLALHHSSLSGQGSPLAQATNTLAPKPDETAGVHTTRPGHTCESIERGGEPRFKFPRTRKNFWCLVLRHLQNKGVFPGHTGRTGSQHCSLPDIQRETELYAAASE